MADKFENLLLSTALASSLIFSPAKALAQQQYDACDPANPNYSTECRDESKRDFAKVGEIDYMNVDLMGSKRIFLKKSDIFPNYQGVDYDPYTKKAVCAANISKDGLKLELVIMDAELEKGTLTIDETNKKRVTYDAVDRHIENYQPLWTKDRKIIYYVFDYKTGENESYIINIDGTNKRKLTGKEFVDMWVESHNKTTGMVNVPPSN